ncbi:MAG: DNA-3-methyladenine glycosylase 2 family protein [Candidatus Eisenbacteria bacterium]|nr:DNA-3-methyladenine glycosylase 2 family protein [Candidatus Eisenbacteria bacterium]
MTLDPEISWRAWTTRDRRFDGAVFMGVSSTGIYCRPVCPARLPARRNCTFFASAAAAEAAGYRPCLRCRPETAPGSPAWRGTSALVQRALRLIESGAMEDGSVETLAERLGVTSRWLRGLFAEHVGASPLEVALTRRVHFARRLLDETGLPVADVAAASGFASARRLRAAFGRTFRRAPADVRRAPHAGPPGSLALRLPAREPFEPEPLLAFLSARAIPGVEQVEGRVYRRTLAAGDAATTVEIEASPRGLVLRVAGAAPATLPRLVAKAARVFDLDADAAAISRHLARDPLLRRALAGRTVRVPGAWDAFELGVRALLGQQVSVAAARTLAGRLVRACGTALSRPEGPLTHRFPSPAAVAAAPLDSLGLTRARAAALRGFARAVAGGTLELDAFTGPGDALERLTALPGIGEWTAQYLAMRALGEPDAFPAGDLGVRRALAAGGALPAERQVLARAEAWRPWRAYATLALWQGGSQGATANTPSRRAKP